MEVQDLERMIREKENVISLAFPALMRKVYVWMSLFQQNDFLDTNYRTIGISDRRNKGYRPAIPHLSHPALYTLFGT